MPTYEYACKECGERLEAQQSFSDPALTECPACAGPLRKVFGSIGIAFKGSGFYKTDSRSGAGKGKSTSETAGASTSSEGSSSGSAATNGSSSNGSSSNGSSSNGSSSSGSSSSGSSSSGSSSSGSGSSSPTTSSSAAS